MKTFFWIVLCASALASSIFTGKNIYTMGIEDGLRQGINKQIIGWDLSEDAKGGFVFNPIVKEEN